MFKKILLVGSLLGLAGNAWALPFLQGGVGFVTAPNASWEATGGTGISDATGIKFNGATGNPNPFDIYNGFDGQVQFATEDFAGTVFAPVDFHDFTFIPLGDPLNPLNNEPTLWSFSINPSSGLINYELKMTSVNIVSQSVSQIGLRGTAILTATDAFGADKYAATNGFFDFTANATNTVFNYSSGAAVPEPASLALLGIGILGMAFPQIRRREENS